MNISPGFARSLIKASRVLGLFLLVGYLALPENWSFSAHWALAYPSVFLVIVFVVFALHLQRRFPTLIRYLLPALPGPRLTEDQWARAYVLSKISPRRAFGLNYLIFTAFEDALICVPVVLLGSTWWALLLGGIIFGALHLFGYTYLECISKAVGYYFVLIFILPHGLLTVVVGHFINNLIALIAMLAIAVWLRIHDAQQHAQADEPASRVRG